MTETEQRQFLTKHLGKVGYSVERNESGAINEGYPDLTISKDKKSILLELKQGHLNSKGDIIVEKYQPRQKGKMVSLAFTHTTRILVVLPDKSAYLLSAPFTKFKHGARCVRWQGTLESTCGLAWFFNSWWEDLAK